jgi:hypothetical protein
VVVLVTFLPESPKYLMAQSKFDELRAAMSKIAYVNGIRQGFSGRFDREAETERVSEF